ncbi:heat-shock protein Hsp70 [Sorangium cellulosum]|uniref:Heat-shock protein Hsp70 n=1 Tax=Sorangium cellulosum TaxID=56 RepID=A0A2L0EUS9_SORCE|nr:Hsp70 family protein [Sorangium cellulosum]AUX43054.1 heat-shock protein Hsp70 [Sorangium cellulosum]
MTDIVGIDLGTTNSLIGAVRDGKAALFADATGAELMPSAVGALPGGEILVGRAARNRRVLDPEGTVLSIKRQMGADVRRRVGGRELSPPQISALILGALLDRAGAALGQRPRRAVITVPAYFNDAQRQATRDAGQLAGLTVERLVNEPTAAALTYQSGAEQLVLVYDLGGGTFDVSILEHDEGLLEVRTSRGDTRLGGDDIDRAIMSIVLGRLGPSRASVEADARAMTRLLEAVERAKIALSDREEVRLFDPFLTGEGAGAAHLDMPLAREDVEAAARPFVERTLACIDAALRDARLRPAQLDRVLLVGGSSKMPLVRRMVSEHLGRPAQLDLDADRAVALGASLLAGRIAGERIAEVLVDITPHTLSIGVLPPHEEPERLDDLDAAPVIPRGSVVPVERTTTVYTTHEDQKRASLPIAQGEHHRLGMNTQLGELRVGPLPPSPAQSPVEVTFRLDLSGVLHVAATHLPSGTSAAVEIANSPYQLTAFRRAADQAEIEALRAGASEGEPDDGATESDLSLAKAMLARVDRALGRPGGDAAALARVREAAAALTEAVERRAPGVAALTDELSDALLDLV